MIHDLKQLAADAKSVRADRAQFAPTNPPVYIGHAPAPDGPDTRLAAFVADLLDETPLTVERLVERGYVHDAIRWPGRPDVPCLRRGKLYVYSTEHTDPRSWSWDHDDAGPSIWPVPRTIGELAMIELMMEGRQMTPTPADLAAAMETVRNPRPLVIHTKKGDLVGPDPKYADACELLARWLAENAERLRVVKPLEWVWLENLKYWKSETVIGRIVIFQKAGDWWVSSYAPKKYRGVERAKEAAELYYRYCIAAALAPAFPTKGEQ